MFPCVAGAAAPALAALRPRSGMCRSAVPTLTRTHLSGNSESGGPGSAAARRSCSQVRRPAARCYTRPRVSSSAHGGASPQSRRSHPARQPRPVGPAPRPAPKLPLPAPLRPAPTALRRSAPWEV